MQNGLKTRAVSILVAILLVISCFSQLMILQTGAETDKHEPICSEGFEDMEGYVFSPEKTYETTKNYSNPTVTIDKTISHSGESSLKYVSKASTVTKQMIKLRTKPGQAQIVNGSRYHVSFYYRVNTTPGSWNLCYTFCSANDWGMNQANLGNQSELEGNTKDIGTAAPNVWTRADVVFTATKATSTYKYLIFYIQAKSKEFEVNFDDITVTEISADDNIVIINGPTGAKALYGKSGEDYSSYIEEKNNDDYLKGIYADNSYSLKVSSTKFGDTTTPITKNIPTSVYLSYAPKERVDYNFKFDSFPDNYTLPTKTESGCSLELSNQKSNSGKTSLKFTGKSNTQVADANIRLDNKSGYDSAIKLGDTYVVSFKYYVDSNSKMQFYYNFAADRWQTDNLNVQTYKDYGWQMVAENGYAKSRSLSGTSADGWQTETVQFTITKGSKTSAAVGNVNPDRLLMCLRSYKEVGNVYIDDISVKQIYSDEYAVCYNTSGGNLINYEICKEGENVFIPENPIRNSDVFENWCTDSSLSSIYTETLCGAESTPVVSYIPFTLYAKYFITVPKKIDFEDFDISKTVSGTATNESKIQISDSQKYSGNSSLEITSTATSSSSAVTKSIVLLKAGDQKVQLNKGKSYIISFKYLVDSKYQTTTYYNYALRNQDTYGNVLSSTIKDNGIMLYNSEGYQSALPLSGTLDNGWQSTEAAFTANADDEGKTYLYLYIQTKSPCNVYIDDIEITEVKDNQNVVQFKSNNKFVGGRVIGERQSTFTFPTMKQDGFKFVAWYYDEKFENIASNIHPNEGLTTLYAKWEESITVVNKIDFENWKYNDAVYSTSNNPNASLTFTSEKTHGGNKSMMFTSFATSKDKLASKAAIILSDGETKCQINQGKSYVVSFWYYVDNKYDSQVYYNLATTASSTIGNLLISTNKTNGVQLFNNEGYAASNKLSGNASSGWQKAVCAFTATTTSNEKNFLSFYIQASKVSTNVYIDDIEINEVEDNQNVVQFKSNNKFIGGMVKGIRGSNFTFPTIKRDGFKFLGWYYDEKFQNIANNIHPNEGLTTLYAKWEESVTVVNNIDFENWKYSDAVYSTSTNPKASLIFTNEKTHSGNNAMKFTSFATSDDKLTSKAAIVLSDGETKCQVNQGKNYLVSFWYYVDDKNDLPFYYNFATTSSSTIGNLLVSTNKTNGVQLYSKEGYAASNKLYGNATTGWQKAVCVFTATTTSNEKNFLSFYIQANKASGNVYIDDFSIKEVSNDVGIVVFMANGGKSVEPIIGKIGTTVKLPSCTPLNSNACFDGWYTSTKYENKVESVTISSEPTTLYSKFTFGYSKMDFDDDYCYADRDKYRMAISKEGLNLEWYTPKLDEYDKENVHSGKNSIHRFFEEDDEQAVLSIMNLKDYALKEGEEYTMRFWVKCTSMFSKDSYMQMSYGTDKTNGWNRIAGDVPNICKVKNVGKDQWVQVGFTFTAKSSTVCFRTMGANELYFDDFEIMWSKYPGYDKFVNEPTVKCIESKEEIEKIGFEDIDDGDDEIFAGDFKLKPLVNDVDTTNNISAYVYVIIGIAGVIFLGCVIFFVFRILSKKKKAKK